MTSQSRNVDPALAIVFVQTLLKRLSSIMRNVFAKRQMD